jgi:hypothetical protein
MTVMSGVSSIQLALTTNRVPAGTGSCWDVSQPRKRITWRRFGCLLGRMGIVYPIGKLYASAVTLLALQCLVIGMHIMVSIIHAEY